MGLGPSHISGTISSKYFARGGATAGSAKMPKLRFGIKRIARMEGIMPRGCEKDASNLAELEIP